MIRRDGLIHSIINYGLEDKQGDKIMSRKVEIVPPTWETATRIYIEILENKN